MKGGVFQIVAHSGLSYLSVFLQLCICELRCLYESTTRVLLHIGIGLMTVIHQCFECVFVDLCICVYVFVK